MRSRQVAMACWVQALRAGRALSGMAKKSSARNTAVAAAGYTALRFAALASTCTRRSAGSFSSKPAGAVVRQARADGDHQVRLG